MEEPESAALADTLRAICHSKLVSEGSLQKFVLTKVLRSSRMNSYHEAKDKNYEHINK